MQQNLVVTPNRKQATPDHLPVFCFSVGAAFTLNPSLYFSIYVETDGRGPITCRYECIDEEYGHVVPLCSITLHANLQILSLRDEMLMEASFSDKFLITGLLLLFCFTLAFKCVYDLLLFSFMLLRVLFSFCLYCCTAHWAILDCLSVNVLYKQTCT